MIRRAWLATLLAVPLHGEPQGGTSLIECLQHKPVAHWLLPPQLREISGLALTDDGRLLAHDDEQARVTEIDYRNGRIVKSFQLGQRPILRDFEGIAMAGTRLFLVTSAGVLYQAREGKDGTGVPFTTVATGAAAWCEVEGLAWDPGSKALLLLCKTPRQKALEHAVTVLRWSVDQRRWMVPERTSSRLDPRFRKAFGAEFRGSDLARDPVTGHFLAIAGLTRAVVELSSEGAVIGTGSLGAHHRQAEGVAIAKDGTVLISDEGGKGAGRLAVYACKR
jgi:uncharacterized protein YjiK